MLTNQNQLDRTRCWLRRKPFGMAIRLAEAAENSLVFVALKKG
jgi:hypothetical protein